MASTSDDAVYGSVSYSFQGLVEEGAGIKGHLFRTKTPSNKGFSSMSKETRRVILALICMAAILVYFYNVKFGGI